MKRLFGSVFRLFFSFILLVNLTACLGTPPDFYFFQNKTITIIIPYGSGGGVDTYGRTIVPFLQKYLPQSKIEVKNITGSGGLEGKNLVYNAQPDGLTLGFAPISGALLAEWEGALGVNYKTANFSYIGRIGSEAHVMTVSPKSGLKSLDDIIQAKKIKMGFTGVGSDDYFVAMITADALGYQVDPQKNFISAGDAVFSCVKGDVDAILFSDSSIHAQIIEKTINPVVVFSQSRLTSLPNIPTIFEVVPADKQPMVQTLIQIYALDRILYAPPGMDPSRLNVLRKAFDQAVADPEFRQTMVTLNRPINYMGGNDVDKLVKNVLSSENQIKPLVLMIFKETQ